jgi:hypothetical protein
MFQNGGDMIDENLITIRRDGQTYGPYTLDELQTYVSEGRIAMNDKARIGEVHPWVSVANILNPSLPWDRAILAIRKYHVSASLVAAAVGFLAWWIVSGLQPPTIDDAKGALLDGKYTTAVDIFRSRAIKGDVEAQAGLALILAYNEGDPYIPRSNVEAFERLRLSAVKGIPSAQKALGKAYIHDGETEEDFDVGNMWFFVAARNGDAKAANVINTLADILPFKYRVAEIWSQNCIDSGYTRCDGKWRKGLGEVR